MTSQAPPQRSLKRNYFFSAISALIGIAYPIITLAYVARVIGPEALGKYYFVNSLASYFMFGASLGIPIYGAREIARARGNPDRLKKVFSELFVISAASSALAWVVYGFVVLIVPDFHAEALMFGIFSLLLVSNAFSFEYLYSGLERQDQIAYRSLVTKLISIVLIFTFVQRPEDYLRFGIIVVGTALVNALLGFGALKYWGGTHSLAGGGWKRHLHSLALIAASLLLFNVYINLDSVILGIFAPAREVGLYNAGIRPPRLMATLLASMVAASVPRLSQYVAEGHIQAHRNLQKKSFELLFLLVVPITMTCIFCAPQIVQLLYGSQFNDASFAMALAAPVLLLNCFASFQGYQILFPIGKELAMVTTAAAGAVLSLSLNLILIPTLGHRGAIIAALSAECASIAVQIILIRRSNPALLVFSGQVWKYVAGGAAMVVSQWFFLDWSGTSHTRWLASWTASAGVYLVFLWLLREPFTRQIMGRIIRGQRPTTA